MKKQSKYIYNLYIKDNNEEMELIPLKDFNNLEELKNYIEKEEKETITTHNISQNIYKNKNTITEYLKDKYLIFKDLNDLI